MLNNVYYWFNSEYDRYLGKSDESIFFFASLLPFMNSNYLVTQAYGIDRIKNEAILSILTFFKRNENADVKIVVYTDDDAYFRNFFGENEGIRYEILNAELIRKWKGEEQFVHRLKVEMLMDFCQKYEGKFIYIDSDTFWLKEPDSLFKRITDKSVIMHTCEDRISNKGNILLGKIARFLKKNIFEINREKIRMSPKTIMWNAGLIGMQTHQKGILKEVLSWTDILYKKYPKHVMEQLAFSYVLFSHFNVLAADDIVFHYWQNCKDLAAPIEEFIQKNQQKTLEGKIENSIKFDFQKYMVAEKPKKKKWWFF